MSTTYVEGIHIHLGNEAYAELPESFHTQTLPTPRTNQPASLCIERAALQQNIDPALDYGPPISSTLNSRSRLEDAEVSSPLAQLIDEGAMSSNGDSSTAAWLPKRRTKRTKLRNGTFIVPRTGERSRREFTLQTSSSGTTNSSSEYQTLDYADTFGEHIQIIKHNISVAFILLWQWLQSEEGHGVLKCTIAYAMGSLGTFLPPLSNFLGHRDGKHITATLTVYFHPARTVGSMLEAVVIAIIAVLYAVIVSLISMSITVVFRAQLGMTALAHTLVLIFCIGAGLGFVGWVKQRLNTPLVNVGTTLTSIAIISVVTKEESVHGGYFDDDKIVQVLQMLLIGISFTVLVNILVWKVSARRVLRKSILKATKALGDKLSCITQGFLNGSDEEIWSSEYTRVSAQYNSAYSKISSTLREAKFEHYFVGHETVYPLDRRLVRSIEALSQAIGGLRNALQSQFTLLKEGATGDEQDRPLSPVFSPSVQRTLSSLLDDSSDRLSIIDESAEIEAERRASGAGSTSGTTAVAEGARTFQVPSDIFALFIELLGPSIKSLAHTLSEILREPALDPDEEATVNGQLRDSLRDALNLYNDARRNSLQEIYRIIEMGRIKSEKIQADIEEVAAACGHFSYSLQAVAQETDSYLDVLEDLNYTTETVSRSWGWLKFWKYLRSFRSGRTQATDPERESLLQKPPAVRRLRKSQLPKGIPDTMIARRDTFSWDASPNANTCMRKLSQVLLKVMRFLAREDILFGIKVGLGALIWAQFAFIPATRPIYQLWRGEWGLLSFMIVMGMTTGAANTTGTARFKGTLIGAACAVAAWLISQGNGIALFFIGAFVGFCNFYVILVIKNAPLGRIALLAYNVSTLYAYSLSQSVDDDDDDEGGANPLIFDIVFHRVVAVTLGILWGIIFCRLLWPISGRRKFREGLSVLYLQLGLIWKRGPLTVVLESNKTMDYMREGEQAALQRYAFKLDTLRTGAKAEFGLRGPFPDAAYARIMRSTRHILDGFYAMRLITHKRASLSAGERALLEFTEGERIRLCQRICHVFQVLASCIMLEYPLTDAIPTVENNKDRLLGKIYQFRKKQMEADQKGDNTEVVAEDKDYALVYAYTLVTLQVAAELNKVRNEIEGLFGVLHEEATLLQ